MSDCAKKLDDFLKSAEGIDAQYQQLAFAECCAVLGKHMQRKIWIGYTVCSQLWHDRNICSKEMFGYNLGTPTLKPYKREIKTHQNDTNMQEKAM